MKLVIAGREYDRVGHDSASLLHLIELRQQTRGVLDEPLGMHRLEQLSTEARDAKRALAAAEAAGDADGVERWTGVLTDSGDVLMAVLIFLSRRKAGDKGTFSELVDVDMSTLQFVAEDGDDEEGDESADPTVPADGTPVTPGSVPAPPAARASRGSSTTRKPRSPSGSRT